ncbi:MAG: HDOD domain-containing protein [Fibrobacterales bacterium]
MELSKLTTLMLNSIEIPAQPDVLVQFLATCRSQECEITIITNILQQDMALVASILRTVNSAAFGLEYNVTSVQQAIMLMGLKNLGNLVNCFCMRQALYNGDKELDVFWEQSNHLSIIATHLAKRYTRIEPDEVYATALLSNCGVPSLTERSAEYLKRYLENVFNNEQSITKYEDKMYCLDHSVVGYYLAKRWNLPEFIYYSIYYHHSTDLENDFSLIKDESLKKKIKETVLLLQLSEYIYSKIHLLNEPFSWFQNREQIMDGLKATEPEVEVLIEELHADYQIQKEVSC